MQQWNNHNIHFFKKLYDAIEYFLKYLYQPKTL
jgi:hypothetical protein